MNTGSGFILHPSSFILEEGRDNAAIHAVLPDQARRPHCPAPCILKGEGRRDKVWRKATGRENLFPPQGQSTPEL